MDVVQIIWLEIFVRDGRTNFAPGSLSDGPDQIHGRACKLRITAINQIHHSAAASQIQHNSGGSNAQCIEMAGRGNADV